MGEIILDTYFTIEGGFFCGNKIAIKSFENMFYEQHDLRMVNNQLFAESNDDQTVMTAIANDTLNSDKIVLLKTDLFERTCTDNYDDWFFYQNYLASSEFYSCKTDKFSLLVEL